MRCDQCVHWKNAEPEYGYEKTVFGTCGAIDMRETAIDAAFADKPRGEFDDWDEVEAIEEKRISEIAAWAVDASSYHAGLETQGHFGCVLFEKKP